jgi:cobalt transporter subunit CbtA
MFKHITATAALAGVLAGLVLTAVQQIEVVPLIRAAEIREAANATVQAAISVHPHQAWSPQDGWERLIATAVANIVLATAFALLLVAAMSLRRHFGWRAGLGWGIAGYAVFFVAPAIGIPPALPGSDSIPLADRQMWWIGVVSCSIAGLWLAAFAKQPLVRVLGFALIVAPHVFGARQPYFGGITVAGDGAAHAFVRATFLVNAVLWILLGILVGALCKSANSSDAEAPTTGISSP